MNQGIYLLANDKVIDNAIALLNSIFLHDPLLPIYLVPFDQNYQQIEKRLGAEYHVKLFPDLDFLERFTQNIANIFDRDFLALPNKMRKLILWFGPLEKFLYLDTDIIVFQPLAPILDLLDQQEFICCDYHHKHRKIEDIFSDQILTQEIFTPQQLEDVFNSGFWASRRGLFSESELYTLLQDCAQHRDYFDFTYRTTDQPLLNYIILKTTTQRLNLTRINSEAGSWAGSPHFQRQGNALFDRDRPLRYLHWAGTPMKTGGPYRKIWEHYRYLKEPNMMSRLARFRELPRLN
ncbi:MAG: hypothetical protein VKL42_19330 [Snowella sp.]|nr:hypothetical protein [Snowella sp.]